MDAYTRGMNKSFANRPAPLIASRVCRALRIACEVKVLTPGIRGAEG